MKKERVIETIKDFPTEFEVEELIEKLIFIDKVEKGLKQVKEGTAQFIKDLQKLLCGISFFGCTHP